MSPVSQNVALHRSIGKLLEQLDQPGFWRAFTRQMQDHVPVDNWVALVFSNSRPKILDFAEAAFVGYEPDPIITAYVTGLYLLDPFYISNREKLHGGFFHLSDVAPECFKETEYYKRYFSTYVFEDEIQYNVQLDKERTLCLSIGSKIRFTEEHIATLELMRPWVVALMRQRMFFEGLTGVPSEKPLKPLLTWQEDMKESMKAMGTPLTARELDVMRLVLSGCSNKEVAEKLVLSAETVKVHRRHFYAKLNIKSQSELFALFLKAQTASFVGHHA